LVLKASPVLLAYHASETIGFTNAFALLAPTRFQNHWFSYRFSIACTHVVPKPLPVPDFNNFLNKNQQNHWFYQIVQIGFATNRIKPLVLPDFPDVCAF
jgi:hypothetical protein